MNAQKRPSSKALHAAIKAADMAGKPTKLSDGGGLLIDARPKGTGGWRIRYWQHDRGGVLGVGTYPGDV